MKLKYTEIQTEREKRFEEQKGICSLCGEAMDRDHSNALVRPVLDHCHHTGRVRAVIHGDCNVLLGKIENFTRFKGKSMSGRLAQALEGVYSYMSADYSDEPYHPKHRFPHDKEILRLKRILRRSKRPETKAKYRKLIADLQ